MEVEHKMSTMEIELTELLIQIFKAHGWEVENLPSIYDSNESPKTPVENQEWDFDGFLGVYKQTNGTWCDVGKVILYPKNIEKVAKAFYEHDQQLYLLFLHEERRSPDYGVKLEDAINFLTTIVLIHELTHWMIHWNRDFNGKALKCYFNYDLDENKNFHEGLAQYFTDNTIRKLGVEKMIALFDYLKHKQSRPYRVFEELKTDLDGHEINVACVFTALGVCWNNNFTQEYNKLKALVLKCSSITQDDFHVFLNAINENRNPYNQEIIIELFKKTKRNPFFEQYMDEKTKNWFRGSLLGNKFGI